MDQAASAAGAEIVSLEFDLPDAPEKVWRALREPAIVARWIAPGVDEVAGASAEPRHALIDAESGRRVSYRWRDRSDPDSIVTFSIVPGSAGGTRLRIVHSRGTLAPAALSGPLACRFAVAGRAPTLCAANLNQPRARAA